MADIFGGLAPTALVPPGHYGNAGEGVRITLLSGMGLASLAAAPGTGLAHEGAPLPARPAAMTGGGITFIGMGPSRWLALARESGPVLEERLAQAFSGRAAVADQSDGFLLLALEGPAMAALWEKTVPIDMDAGVFGPGAAATTVAAGIGLTLWRPGEAPVWHLLVARSYAPALLRLLVAGAAADGCRVDTGRA